MNTKHAGIRITTALISTAPLASNFTNLTTVKVHAAEDQCFYTVEVQLK